MTEAARRVTNITKKDKILALKSAIEIMNDSNLSAYSTVTVEVLQSVLDDIENDSKLVKINVGSVNPLFKEKIECKTCASRHSIQSMTSSRIKRDRDSENTGFCMIYWTNCTCLDCGAEWEEGE